MRLHVVYRSTGIENAKQRPPYYDKPSCVRSLARTFADCPEAGELVFLNVGAVSDAQEAAMRDAGGELVPVSLRPATAAYWTALSIVRARGWPDEDVVYLAEDDYVHRRDALRSLAGAARAFGDVDYLAAYATIGLRMPNGEPLHPGMRRPPRVPDEPLGTIDGHQWRRALSTTSTFAVRIGALRRDLRLHHLAPRTGAGWDHALSLAYQGIAPFAARDVPIKGESPPRSAILTLRRATLVAAALARRRSGHVFAAADPALATHAESGVVALGTDWALEAQGAA